MAQPRKALGKGIGALIPSAAPRRQPMAPPPQPAAPDGDRVEKIALDAIELNPNQPRVHFGESDLQELSASIAEHGVLQPILVRPLPEGRYQLIAGERRLRASLRADLADIPALVKPMNDDESLLVAIIENVQRADLNPLEEAQAFQVLLTEFELTQDEVAKRVGKSRPAIANALRLLHLPEDTQQEIRAGRISAGHARALLGLEDPGARETLTRQIIDGSLSVREVEKAVQEKRTKPASKPAPKADPDVAIMEADLSRALGTKVSIATTHSEDGRGRVELSFYSHDDLARLVDLLRRAAHGSKSRSARA
ncbi:MAG: ParB/RepB/Spo0J family partition protein [Candidatus Binatia bacterium]|nr:ParB/RepB/Spo0J family partition protein [Candidatus Binatia bacterium]